MSDVPATELRELIEEELLANLLAERILAVPGNSVSLGGRLSMVGEVFADLRRLGRGDGEIPGPWRLTAEELDRAPRLAMEVIDSLEQDPAQGEPMRPTPGAAFLSVCRRLAVDPADGPPPESRGRPVPRLAVVWMSVPNDAEPRSIRVLAVTHRFDWRLRQPPPAVGLKVRSTASRAASNG